MTNVKKQDEQLQAEEAKVNQPAEQGETAEKTVETARETMQALPSKSPEEIQRIKNEFYKLINHGNVLLDEAYEIMNNEGKNIDFTSEIREEFLRDLQMRVYLAFAIFDHPLSQGIDFTPEIKQGFRGRLIGGYDDYTYGNDDSIEWGCLDAKAIYDKFSKVVDLTPEIKEIFLKCITDGWSTSAFEIQEIFGHNIDFTKEIITGFFDCLARCDAEQAREIYKKYGKTIKFSELPGYAEAIKTGFRKYLRIPKNEDGNKDWDEFLPYWEGLMVNRALDMYKFFGRRNKIDLAEELKTAIQEHKGKDYYLQALRRKFDPENKLKLGE